MAEYKLVIMTTRTTEIIVKADSEEEARRVFQEWDHTNVVIVKDVAENDKIVSVEAETHSCACCAE